MLKDGRQMSSLHVTLQASVTRTMTLRIYTVPLKCKLPPSLETCLVCLEMHLVSLETGLTSLEMRLVSFESFLVSRGCTASTSGEIKT